MGEPGTLYAAQAGVASIDHATQLSEETIRLMRRKESSRSPRSPSSSTSLNTEQRPRTQPPAAFDYKIKEFKKQVAAGVPFAVGSDVGPFPHGTQAREIRADGPVRHEAAAVLQADLINGAKLLGWEGQIGELKPGYYADIIAVPGNPLEDITTLGKVSFVMKGGDVLRQ